MRRRNLLIIRLGIFLFVPLAWLEVAVPAAPPGTEAPPSVVAEKLGWKLTDAKMVNAGESLTIPQGILINGYTVEATATPLGEGASITGKFRMTLSLFSPSEAMPGQKVGYWYVNGIWTITDVKASIPAAVRHSPNMLSGRLIAELSFNPARTPGQVVGSMLLPGVSAPGKRTVAKATFAGNEKFEGTIRYQGSAEAAPASATSKEAGK